jgi:hypothetical protein
MWSDSFVNIVTPPKVTFNQEGNKHALQYQSSAIASLGFLLSLNQCIERSYWCLASSPALILL